MGAHERETSVHSHVTAIITLPLAICCGAVARVPGNAQAVTVDRQTSSCSGQGKTDTELSGLEHSLVGIGTDIAQIRVQPRAVVKHFDIVNHIIPRFLPGGILAMSGPFPFQTPEESFGDCIIKTFSLPAHTTAHARVR